MVELALSAPVNEEQACGSEEDSSRAASDSGDGSRRKRGGRPGGLSVPRKDMGAQERHLEHAIQTVCHGQDSRRLADRVLTRAGSGPTYTW